MRTEFKNHETHVSDIVSPTRERSSESDKNGISALRKQFEHLTECFLKDSDPEILTTQSDSLDSYFQDSFAGSITGIELDPINNPYAIIARGNYGRKEICSQPKVTILFIFSTTIPENADGLIKDIIYPLWDLNLSITYSIRTVKECIADAKKDYTYLLSVLDSRFVCGASLLFYQLINTIREKVVFSKKKEIAALQYKLDKKRQEKYGSNEFLLEPDLVCSKGGLKDLNSILSIARSNLNLFELVELKQSKIISEKDYDSLVSSIEYIKKVVRFLNITNKGSSRLLVKHQHAAARFMKYRNTEAESGEDLFLSDLCRHMNTVRKTHYSFFLFISPRSFAINKNLKVRKLNTPDWLFKAKGLISFKSVKKIKEKPLRLLEIFIESEKLEMPLNSDALRMINDYHYLLNSKNVDIKKAGELFEQNLFLSTINSTLPFALLDTGILTTLIPELLYTVNKKTAGYFHIHPFCHHLLFTLNNLKKIFYDNTSQKTEGIQKAPSIGSFISVFWAGLLHDLKPDSVREILIKFGKSPDVIENVCFLTNNYNLLYNTVSRENIDGGKTIRCCSNKIKSYEQLHHLYFLTIATTKATGPRAYNEYLIKDLGKLYHQIIEFRFNKKIASNDRQTKIDDLLQLCHFHKIESAHTFISGLDLQKYQEVFSYDELFLHLTLNGETKPGEIAFSSKKTDDIREVTILTKSSTCTLMEIIGVLLEHKITIYDYRSYVFEKKISVHTFRFKRHKDKVFENEKWLKIKDKLNMAASGNSIPVFDKESFRINEANYFSRKPSRVKITPSNSDNAYVIDFISKECHGTLYKVINRLLLNNIQIVFFRKTEGSQGCLYIFHIIDTFRKLEIVEAKKELSTKLIEN